MPGAKAIKGALQRAEGQLPNHLSDERYRTIEANKGWDDQWWNWDDLGPDDPTPGGWGDIGE